MTIRFLQEFYGFVICDFNYQSMLAYRELARLHVILAASVVRTVGPNRLGSAGSTVDVDTDSQWQMVCSQLVHSAP